MPSTQLATFGGGCFWGVEESFRTLEGVAQTTVGYMGGNKEQATYEQVCTDKTGHVEVVHVEFDPQTISYESLVRTFFEVHDPTQVNRQGPDIGTQYRSVIFYHSAEQKQAAERVKDELDASGKFALPIATAIEPAKEFFEAEEYHQKYLMKRGLNVCHV